MICANCRRPLKHPAAQVGRMRFGRQCARQLGLIEGRGLTAKATVAERDPHTPDLFDEETSSQ